jgi:hypothetical protein
MGEVIIGGQGGGSCRDWRERFGLEAAKLFPALVCGGADLAESGPARLSDFTATSIVVARGGLNCSQLTRRRHEEESEIPFSEEAGASPSVPALTLRMLVLTVAHRESARTGRGGRSTASTRSRSQTRPHAHTSSRNGPPKPPPAPTTASTSGRSSGSTPSGGICPQWYPWTTSTWRDTMEPSRRAVEEREQTRRRSQRHRL